MKVILKFAVRRCCALLHAVHARTCTAYLERAQPRVIVRAAVTELCSRPACWPRDMWTGALGPMAYFLL